MNLLSTGVNSWLVTIEDTTSYGTLAFIVRLLTYEEMVRVTGINISTTAIKISLEDDIYDLCVTRILGFENVKDLDVNTIDAGVITSVSKCIYETSKRYYNNPEQLIEESLSESTLFDQMKLVVANGYNIDHRIVQDLPIDELMRKFALYQATFPQSALTFSDDESNKPQATRDSRNN